MVEATCIDDNNRPKEIGIDKWLKKGEKYNIIFTTICLPQNEIGVHLSEINLTEKELPYEFFMLRRFSFSMEELLKLIELIKSCNETQFSISELIKQTQLETVE
jgi:hypothetical protein